MAVIVEYRTISIEENNLGDYWYEGDNEPEYETLTEALEKSDVIADWRRGVPTDLTSVRVRNTVTDQVSYILPHVR